MRGSVQGCERRFLRLLGSQWRGTAPGISVQAHLAGRKVCDVRVGDTFRFYDWASLTKIVFSASVAMQLVQEKRLRLSDPIVRHVPWFKPVAKGSPDRLRDLLTHSAGLDWWRPYYKKINRRLSRVERWEQLMGLLEREAKAQGAKRNWRWKSVYSDLDLFYLARSFEHVTGEALESIWWRLADRLNLKLAHFNFDNRPNYARGSYAPTERCPWRKKTLRGEVHDENTWSLGGFAPHAGLFGTHDDLSDWGLLLRGAMQGRRSSRFLAPETVALFTKRHVPRTVGDWAYGFMVPTKGRASCGPKFSPRSVGHTGFTGTSLWYDPKRDLLVTILSNRVHPTRTNQAFVALRPKLHTWIVEAL